jgi:pSer/pThr/pTyr-binding forkhead associated (FHA) protein
MSAVEELNWEEQESATGRYRELPKIALNVPKTSDLTKIELRSKGKFLSEHFFGSGKVIVGRSPDNEIDVESPFVSRRHAQIVSDQTGSTIEDLNSTNGIFVNDKRVKKHRLRDGDIVAIGFHQLVYTDLREASKNVNKKSAASGKGL